MITSGLGRIRRGKWLCALALLALLAHSEQPLVLTGVIAASNGGKAYAVIEMADGQQRLVGVGDRVGEATVTAVHAQSRSVSLAFADGVRVLTLTGTAFPEEYREPYNADDYMEQASSLNLPAEQVRELLELAQESEALGEAEATARLNRLLGLPAGARIDGYADQPVASALELLAQLVPKLMAISQQGGHLGVLSVADPDGRSRLYLSAETEPQGR